METLKGKTAVITGAGSGLGLEFSKLAARLGMNVTLVDINSESLEKVHKEITELGAKSIMVKADVSKYSDVENVAQKSEEAFGPTSLLMNNAGVGGGGLIWEVEEKEWHRVLGIDFHGVLNGVRVFVPRMLKAAQEDPNYLGHIVNTGSMAGFCAMPTMGPYNIAKAGVISISETLQADLDLVTDQIKVSVLAPGFIRTNIANASIKLHVGTAQDLSKVTVAGYEMVTGFVNGSEYVAKDIADTTFNAIKNGDFYIFSGDREEQEISAKTEKIKKRAFFNSLKSLDEKAYERMMKLMDRTI